MVSASQILRGGLEISHIGKQFRRPDGETVAALSDVSISVKPGSFVSLIGPSGCGKSTLLRLISGLEFPSHGKIFLGGKEITGPGADRGFMFQEHNLFPWLTIRENIAFGLKARNLYKSHQEKVDQMLELVGLKDFANSYPHQLSGGMCQRASLARALVAEPDVLLLDEPLGALDAFTRMNIQDEIARIWKEKHMTMIMVTHDVEEAVYLSDTVVVMTARPGRVVQSIAIDLPRPRQRSSEAFFHYSSQVLDLLHYGGRAQTA